MTTRKPDLVRYTTGAVTYDVRSEVLRLLEQGKKVTNIRNEMRAAGFKLRNQTVSDIIKESKVITDNRLRLARLTRGSPRRMVSPTVTDFTTRYMYHGKAVLTTVRGGAYQPALEERKDKSYADWLTDPENLSGGTRYTRDLEFGSDELLTAERIRERFFDITAKGFENQFVYYAPYAEEDLEDVMFENDYFIICWHIQITSVLDSG
jgi:hypothetical protein